MITSISSCVLLLSCLFHVTLAASSVYGDATVILFKDISGRKQLNVFKGDYFLVEVTLRHSDLDEYLDIKRLIVTQSVQGLSEDKNVTFVLERVENYLFNITSVGPVNRLGGTVVSASANNPNWYHTKMVVGNSADNVLSNTNIRKITLSSYGIVTNSGIQVQFLPFQK